MAYILGNYPLPDGRLGFVIHLTFGRARILVGPDGDFYDDAW